MRFGNVKEVLKRNNVPFDEEELDTRLELLVKTLRGNYDQSEVDAFVRGQPKGQGYVELPKIQYGAIRRMVGGAENPFKPAEPEKPVEPTENPFKPAEPVVNPFKPAEPAEPEKPMKKKTPSAEISELKYKIEQLEARPPEFKPDPDDFLAPWMKWFVEVASGPYARKGFKILFMVIFFVAYLEKLPMIGGILGAALDLTVGAAKAGTKLIQQGLVTLFGIIPFGGILGIMLATVFGWFAWGLIAAVSFSRTEFGEALSASFRTIMYPLGNMLGDIFDSANRVAGKIQMQAGKIWSNIKDILRKIGSFNKKTQEGVDKITEKIEEARPELKTPNLVDKAKDFVSDIRGNINTGELMNRAVSTAASGVVAAKGLKRSFDEKVAEKSSLPNTFRGGRKSKSKWKTLRNRFDRTFESS